MANFTPGKIIGNFKSKKGDSVILRYPKWEDLDKVLDYINKLSKEDTFVLFSGETITKEQEAKYLADVFKDMELRNKIVVWAFIKEQLVGICNVDRIMVGRERLKHVGKLGVSVAKDYRGEGIGYELGKRTIKEAKKLSGIKMITLTVFGINRVAQNLYSKLGFKQAGTLPKYIFYKGKYIDEIIMYIEL